MTQNIYDDPAFFDDDSQLGRRIPILPRAPNRLKHASVPMMLRAFATR